MNPQQRLALFYCLYSKPSVKRLVLLLIVIVSVFVVTQTHGQDGLHVGDTVPDVVIPNVLNHPSETVRLSDFRGQLLILDFWASWCSPCVAMFPKIDSLQKVFEGKVRFFPVTYESREKVEKLFSRTPRLAGVKLPMAVGEKELHKLFPHRWLPHYVWIDGTGRVKGITGGDEINADNIRKMLSEKATTLSEKKDKVLPYDRQKPLLLNELGIDKDVVKYQTLLTGYIDGLGSHSAMQSHKGGGYFHFTAINTTVKYLYQLAFSSPSLYIERNRVIVEVKDPSRLIMKGASTASREEIREWMGDNAVCYEIIVPPQLTDDIFAIMRDDLQRLFPEYTASLEKRRTRCLVLERTSEVDKIKSAGDSASWSFASYGARLTNCSLGLLLSQLNGITLQNLEIPIVDRTGYTGRVDLELNCNLSDPVSINMALKAYDLALVPREMELDMLIIRDSQQTDTP